MSTLSGIAMVGDIGGTNCRLSLVNLADGSISTPIIYSAVENPSLEKCVLQFREECGQDFDMGCLAIASAIDGDYVQMTNNPWAFSISELKEHTKLKRLDVINDFTAMCMSVTCVKSEDLVQIGGTKPVEGAPIAVYGAGTGLGVAHIIKVGERWIPLPGEGGHVDMAPANVNEDMILLSLRGRIGHVSAERVLSGPGLVNLYEAIAMRNERVKPNMQPADVTNGAFGNPPDPDCLEAVNTFCRLMGSFGGNLALNLSTFGGVYIAGGVVPHFLDFFKKSQFRQAFEDKGRFKSFLKDIPVYVITDKLAGLRGAGAVIRQELGAVL
ncbi:MAG: glucokinase [Succinivibrio sp.]|nr:glucokinase [Succinivibrio sp.]